MDFSHGLNNDRYAEIKVQYLNRLQIKNITAPMELTTIFNLAYNCLKPKVLVGVDYASTYATKVDHVGKKKEDSKNGKKTSKEQRKEQQETKQDSKKR
jgi:hypothetical protein